MQIPQNDGYTYCPQSHKKFGPVVKPLGITVTKESGKVVETSPQKSYGKGGYSPGAEKSGPKKVLKFEILKN